MYQGKFPLVLHKKENIKATPLTFFFGSFAGEEMGSIILGLGGEIQDYLLRELNRGALEGKEESLSHCGATPLTL